MNKLYSIGELIIDFQSIGTSGLKDTNQFVKNAGGAPANVCVQATKFGQKAVYLSKVGNDGFGDFLIETLKNEGIDTTYVSKSNNHDTSLAFVSFKEEGEREFSFYRRCAADLYFTKEDFSGVNFSKNDILEFGTVALKTKEAQEAHNYLIEKAVNSNALIAFDPNLRFNLWDDLEDLKCVTRKYLKYSNIVKIGSDELEFITGKNEEESVIELFGSDKLQLLLVTYGSKGASLYLRNGDVYKNTGYKVNAIDTTGAGDSFFGGFLALVLEHGLDSSKYQEMLDMACRCGAYTATGYGAIKAMGTKKEVMEAIK